MTNFKGKTILITGGTGSFGGYFVDCLRDKNFKEIRVFSRDEMKQEQMRQMLNDSRIKFYIGDIAVCYEIINFRSKKKQFNLEFDKVWTHGLLHLIGYNHIKNQDFLKMNRV